MTEVPVLYGVNTALGRFGIANHADSPDPFVSSMPAAGLINPLTGFPTAGPLAVLVDHVAGLVNHYRRADDEWTVSSELSLELTPTALTEIAAAPDLPVVATARPIGTTGSSAFGTCKLTIGDTAIGVGTVRSVYVRHPGEFPQEWPEPVDGVRPTDLVEIMALRLDEGNGSTVLHQQPNPVLNNSLGIVHGGVAAAGLELAASAALNANRPDRPLITASLRVNFLRQFLSGDESRYVGTALRTGRRSGVADAQAISADGTVALVGRVTAYR
ncbi:hotdog domain-containing protein [Mycobacterium sp. 1274761.0]|uniref:PaaI family thioesterase n=1 Tax=Mycobacterium sp. 1274761.0 TaxID=1834077 RepID=UPI0007FCA492|nr:hotdog domain-containing protein [Mycobacterium sp. 1274761.0]OBK72444.1 phenylacetic acid degradation protein [Mycobacterium sp. 1274761.0]